MTEGGEELGIKTHEKVGEEFLQVTKLQNFLRTQVNNFRIKLECLSPGKPFQPNLMFAGAYPRVEHQKGVSH
jgi:hypothetical protein